MPRAHGHLQSESQIQHWVSNYYSSLAGVMCPALGPSFLRYSQIQCGPQSPYGSVHTSILHNTHNYFDMIENFEHIICSWWNFEWFSHMRNMTNALKYHLLLWETLHKPPMTKQKEISKKFTITWGTCAAGTPECAWARGQLQFLLLVFFLLFSLSFFPPACDKLGLAGTWTNCLWKARWK